jgi:tetratricopeptide (TPR) repeat protein
MISPWIRAEIKASTKLLLAAVLGATALTADPGGQSMPKDLQHGEPAKLETTPAHAGWDGLIVEGRTLRDQSRYADSEHYLRSAVTLAREFGSTDPRYAESLNALATVVQIRGRYDEAERLFQQALGIWRHSSEHRLDLAVGLCNLANLLRIRGRYFEAEHLQLEAVNIESVALPPECPIALESFYGLGAIRAAAGRWEEAEATLKQVFPTQCKVVGHEHPSVAKTMSDLGHLYYLLGPENIEVGYTLNKLAELQRVEGFFRDGETLETDDPDLGVWPGCRTSLVRDCAE